jgi:hypothetical protein
MHGARHHGDALGEAGIDGKVAAELIEGGGIGLDRNDAAGEAGGVERGWPHPGAEIDEGGAIIDKPVDDRERLRLPCRRLYSVPERRLVVSHMDDVAADPHRARGHRALRRP